jgi:hydrophobic/amphiphilic exporter-1 (mainly G- bacteria), HAE1 family
MKLADVSIKRPVFAFMMTAALITLGLASYRELGLDLMPKTDAPTVSVMVSLPGASSEEIESQITKRVEEAVNTINGIDELRSSSDQGSSRVTITFVLEREIEAATQDVRDKVAPIVRQFPQDTQPPIVNKMDPDSSPILTLVISGERSQIEITDIADKKIKQILETVPDVGEVMFMGQRQREIRLLLNADRMNAYGLTVDQVRLAVSRQNVEIPGGTFLSGPSEIALRTMGRITNVDDFNRIIIAYRADGSTIKFQDVGRVVDTFEEPRSIARLNGLTAVTLMIRKQSGTNTVEVVDSVMARLGRIKPTLPSDIKIFPSRDQSVFIRRSFEDIQIHLVLGGLLASLVVFLFLRNLRSTFIAALAIPTSIIGTFTVMKVLGFTLNNMTMLALSLATGIVIDDAIVVLENIFRYIEEKHVAPREAAGKATGEIGLAVMATTLSLCVIFLPVAFMTGMIGQYFFSFGIVSVAAFLISMFVSFTLTPALCASWLRSTDSGHGKSSKNRGLYAMVDRLYGHLLGWSLRHRWVMIVIAITVACSAALLFPRVGKELVPDDDQSEFSVNVRLPRGTNFSRTTEYVENIEAELKKLPEVENILSSIQTGSANYWIGMTPLESRKISQQDLMRQARTAMRKFPGARISVSGGTDISGASTGGGGRGGPGGGGGSRVMLLIQGPEIDQLQAYVIDLLAKMKTIPGLVDADTNYEATQPELRILIDRARAADLGVNIDSLASNLRLLVGGNEVSKYKEGDDQYSVQLRLDEQFRNDPNRLGILMVPGAGGRALKVSDIAQLQTANGPAAIDRYNRQRQISLFASLDGIPLAEGIAAVQSKVEEMNLKPGYAIVFTGSARTLDEASNDFVIGLILAVAFIYMVLASQFNSFVHPLTIMTALPLSLPAGLLALMAFGMTVNVYSGIGLMMLFGIVKKNSILQVDYTNTLRAEGYERHEAIIAANHVRLRPILMTTISIIAGMTPIAFGRGAGAGSRASMAVTIIGGQTLCLLLTLLVTPVVYSLFDDLREWRVSHLFSWLRRTPAQETAPVGK